mgnify:CR=1 FL=1
METLNKPNNLDPNIIIILLDQASNPFHWENEHVKQFRAKNMKTMEFIRNNSVNLNNHHIASSACVPSRATLFTGLTSKKTNVHETDGVAKTPYELKWLDPSNTPTLGNIAINSGKYNLEDVVYIGKHHLKETLLLDEDSMRVETIDKTGKIIEQNLKIYRDNNMLSDLGFTWLSGVDPHGMSELNAGYLVDPGYVDIAIDWLKTREKSNKKNPFIMTLSLVEPHDLVYFPTVWRMWGKKIPFNKKIDIDNIPVSPTDNEDLSQYPMVYQNWVKRYDKYFTKQDPKFYRQFYYYLLTLADDNLSVFMDYFINSVYTDNTVIVFTSDHGDSCGTHCNGYQKWYTPFEEVTNVFCNIMKFENGVSKWKYEINYPTSHIDIVPTICTLLNIEYDNFDGSNIFSNDKKSKNIKCFIQDHITMGNNLTRFPFRIFPQLLSEKGIEANFIPVDRNDNNKNVYPEYAQSIIWKSINDMLYKLIIYHDPSNYDYHEIEYLINNKLILVYNLTNDKCETKNIVENDLEITNYLYMELKYN